MNSFFVPEAECLFFAANSVSGSALCNTASFKLQHENLLTKITN